MRMKAPSTQDGAFAWVLCAMSFLNTAVIGGFVYASGMFYLMFKDSLNVSDSEVALITSINIGVMFSICPFVGILCERFGGRCVAVIGAVISTVGLACSAFSTQIFHLYISYGIIAGAGLGVINIISITVLDSYFHKYKRIACSIALSGYGVGSFLIPPILKILEDIYGWRGAILLMAGINAHMMVTCSLFRSFETVQQQNQSPQPQCTVMLEDEERLPDGAMPLSVPHAELKPDPASTLKRKGLEGLSLFRVIPFLCLCACALIIHFPMLLIVTHFGSYMLVLQFTSDDVVKLYMTLGVSATVARPLAGVVAEVIHANTAMYIMLTILLNGVLTMFVPFMKQLWMIYVYAVVYQLLLGPYLGLTASMVMEHVPKSQVATAYGMYAFFFVPGCVLGAPLGAWLYDYTQVYAHSFYLAASLMIVSGLVMAPAAYYIHKKKL